MAHLIRVSISVLCLPGFTAAQEVGFSYSIAAGAAWEPSYVGSDNNTAEPLGNIELRYTTPGGVTYSAGLAGFGVSVSLLEDAELEFTLEYEPGRSPSDDPILAGFAEVRDTVELQAVYTQEFGPLSLGFGLQADILDRGKGLVGFVGGGYEIEVSERLNVDLGIDFSFADQEHMNTEVGISQAASIASGLAEYNASGGYKGATLTLGMGYQLTERAMLLGEIGLEVYGDSIADSPLVRQEGSRTTQSVALGIVFEF